MSGSAPAFRRKRRRRNVLIGKPKIIVADEEEGGRAAASSSEEQRRSRRDMLDEAEEEQEREQDVMEGEEDEEEEEEDDEEDDEEEEEEDEEDEEPANGGSFLDLPGAEDQEIVNVDFDVEAFVDEDFHSIRNFLVPLLDGAQWNPGEVADLVVSQKQLGSTVKVFPEDEDEEPDVYGFVSVLNLHKYSDVASLVQLREHLLKKCGADERKRSQLQALFADASKPLGLFLNERAVNLPPQLIPPLHKCLFEELDKAAESDPQFRIANFLMITKINRPYESAAAKNRQHTRADSSKRRKKQSTDAEESIYPKEEDPVYERVSSLTLAYPIPQHLSAARPQLESLVSPYRLVMVIPASQIPRVLAELATW